MRSLSGHVTGDLFDHFGIPPGVADVDVNNLHGRAYNLIFNTWFRDENLQTSSVVDLDDGPDFVGDYVLLSRGKRHDYFTSCLPFPQKGDAVSLPLGTKAPISGLGVGIAETFPNAGLTLKDAVSISESYPNALNQTNADIFIRGTGPGAGEIPDVFADLSAVTAVTINELRQAFQVQRMFERDARGGTRYTENQS